MEELRTIEENDFRRTKPKGSRQCDSLGFASAQI
jgi:hypothetical protein